MLTGNADKQTAISTFNEGKIFKFLTKPCEIKSLIDSLEEGTIEYKKLVAQKDKYKDALDDVSSLKYKLEQEKDLDSLTRLINRKKFDGIIKDIQNDDLHQQTKYSLCVIDIDQFSVINEACGQLAGDELLRSISLTLSNQIRHKDVLSRIGSDEFAILFHDCSINDAYKISLKLQETLSYSFTWNNNKFNISVCIGVAELTNADPLLTAQTACNIAKLDSKSKIHVVSPEDKQVAEYISDVQWVAKINNALEENKFSIYYQTIEPINSEIKVGNHFEILIRMLDENNNIIPPNLFLHSCEKYNLASDLDKWVIKNTFKWLCEHPQQQMNLHQCGINLSGQSVGNDDVCKFIHNEFKTTGINPEKIYFEITESAAIGNMTNALNFIHSLKDLGCKIALDDFGSGLSSFAYLKNLPVDYLKIDGAFVKNMDEDKVDFAMVKCITEVGHIMDKLVVAEYVENNSILNKL